MKQRVSKLWDRPVVKNGIDFDSHLGLVGLVVRSMCRSSSEFDCVRSEAMVGLFYASRYWSKHRGFKFSTYAVSCMIGFVKGYRSREARFRARKTTRKAVQKTHRLSLFSELGDHFIRGRARVFARTYDETEEPDCNRKEIVAAYISMLQERSRIVLELRYGFNGSNSYTLEKVARIFRITRERVRQIEFKAVLDLRRMLEKNGVTPDKLGLRLEIKP